MYGKKTTKVAANISTVKAGKDLLCFVDNNSVLYAAGTIGGEKYNISAPFKLADNISDFDICMDNIIWIDVECKFGSYHDNEYCNSVLEEASRFDFGTKLISKIMFNEKYLAYIQDEKLCFLGDYDSLVSDSIEVKQFEKTLVSKNVITFDCDKERIAYITDENKAYLCGYYFVNDGDNLGEPIRDYYDNIYVIDNVDSCTIDGDCLSFCNCDVSTSAYGMVHFNCGNSYKYDVHKNIWIGINNKKPLTWIHE